MTRQEVEDILVESNPNALFFDGFDSAIIGVSERINFPPLVTYSKEKIIEILAEQMEPDADDIEMHGDEESAKQFLAIEYFEFNVAGAYVGEGTPLITTTSNEF